MPETTDQLSIESPEGGHLIFTSPSRAFAPSALIEQTGSSAREVSAPEDANEWVSWFQRHPNLETSEPAPVSVGGASGMRIDVVAAFTPSNYPRDVCGGQPCVPIFPTGGDGGIGSYVETKDRFVIVDVGDETVVIDVTASPDKFDEFASKAQEVLDTLEWGGT